MWKLSDKIFTIAIIGRPNVGKSTLLNRIIGKQSAIVNKQAAFTRDNNIQTTNLFGITLRFIDTAGLTVDSHLMQVFQNYQSEISKKLDQNKEPVQEKPDIYKDLINPTCRQALQKSQAALFVANGQEGVTYEDKLIAKYIRTQLSDKSKLFAVNKMDSDSIEIDSQFYQLGLGDPCFVSAMHNFGMADLYQQLKDSIPEHYFDDEKKIRAKRLQTHNELKKQIKSELAKMQDIGDKEIREWEKQFDSVSPEYCSDYDSDQEVDVTHKDVQKRKPIQISIIGTPNVGKSTFINKIVQEQRVLTDKVAGTTRDAIYIP